MTVDRPVTESFLSGMSSGVKILGEMTLPCEVTRMSDRVFRIILTEGKIVKSAECAALLVMRSENYSEYGL